MVTGQRIDWEKFARAAAHPLAVEILETYANLTEGEKLSPRDVADRINRPLGNVSYHVRVLADAGMLERAGKRQVRGAVQHFYVLA